MKERSISTIQSLECRPVLLSAEPEPIEIDLKKTALIVIDMQNTFVSKGGLFDLRGYDLSRSKGLIKTVGRIINIARANGLKVVYIVHRVSPDFRETGGSSSAYWHKIIHIRRFYKSPETRERLIVRGTWGSEITKELNPRENDVVLEKPKYSAFYGTDLNTTLKAFNINYLLFVGTATNICVEASLRDAFNYGYFCIMISDATLAIGPQSMQDATISNVKLVYGWVTTSASVLEAMKH